MNKLRFGGKAVKAFLICFSRGEVRRFATPRKTFGWRNKVRYALHHARLADIRGDDLAQQREVRTAQYNRVRAECVEVF